MFCKRVRILTKAQGRILIAALVAGLVLLGTYHSFFAIAACGACCLAMLAMREADVISLLFFIMPMASIFKLSPETASLFTYLELLLVLLHIIRRSFWVTNVEILTLFFCAILRSPDASQGF